MAAKSPKSKRAKSFTGLLKPEGPGNSWTFMKIPFDSVAAFGSRGRVSVVMEFGGKEFRTSIFSSGEGTHHMMVNKSMQAAAGAKPGDEVKCTIRADTAERTVEIPAELKKALARNKAAKAAFDGYSWSHRKEYCDYIAEAKKAETRDRRVERAVEYILEKKRVR